MKSLKIFLLVCFLGLTSLQANARSAVAFYSTKTDFGYGYSHGYDTQKEADAEALKNCQERSRKTGEPLIQKCKVSMRPKVAGFGAGVCGDSSCNVAVGYETSQAAVDSAYESCRKNSTGCQSENIKFFYDDVGFGTSNQTAQRNNNASCVPKSSTRQCRSSCTNGNCKVTYNNGCTINVQVQPSFDAFSNQWTYHSPSC